MQEFESEKEFAFITGYTYGGFPYGISPDEMNDTDYYFECRIKCSLKYISAQKCSLKYISALYFKEIIIRQ
jgi:hypothetical protein